MEHVVRCRDSSLPCCPARPTFNILRLVLCSWQSRCDQDSCWQRAVRSPAGIGVCIGCTFLSQRRAVSHAAVRTDFTFPSFKASLKWAEVESGQTKLLRNQRLPITNLPLVSSALLWPFILELLERIGKWAYLRDVFSIVVVVFAVVECVFKHFQPQIVSQGTSVCVGEESIYYHHVQIWKKNNPPILCFNTHIMTQHHDGGVTLLYYLQQSHKFASALQNILCAIIQEDQTVNPSILMAPVVPTSVFLHVPFFP